jgi:RimJ/RimL family protein N-acetyltransferase
MNDFSKVLKEIPYETRNLGIKALEISEFPLSRTSLELVKNYIEREKKINSKIFIQAKVPKAALQSAVLLQKLGFYCIEIALRPSVVLKTSAAYKLFREEPQSFIPAGFDPGKLTVKILSKDSLEQTNQVQSISASSFTADRFHQDPNCADFVADQRFVFWVDEQLQDPSVRFFILEYKNSVIAFSSLRENDLVLIAFKKGFQNRKLGSFFFLQIFKQLDEEGFQSLATSISASNTGMINLCSKLGFKFQDPSMTLHYWTSNSLNL